MARGGKGARGQGRQAGRGELESCRYQCELLNSLGALNSEGLPWVLSSDEISGRTGFPTARTRAHAWPVPLHETVTGAAVIRSLL